MVVTGLFAPIYKFSIYSSFVYILCIPSRSTNFTLCYFCRAHDDGSAAASFSEYHGKSAPWCAQRSSFWVEKYHLGSRRLYLLPYYLSLIWQKGLMPSSSNGKASLAIDVIRFCCLQLSSQPWSSPISSPRNMPNLSYGGREGS